MHLHTMTATDLVDGYRSGRFSPVEATQACLDQIAAVDTIVNAFCLVDERSALDSARQAEKRWRDGSPLSPLDGVPVSIKDLFLTKGWPTLCGSRAIRADSRVWDEDNACVARLRAAGAVFLGKTTTTEFGHKGVGDSPLTGITRNPWNLGMTTGGSSCGAGAATAMRMAPLNLGSDGGGSIRIPASFCGAVGFKPGFGTVPARHSMITGPLVGEGALTNSVRDTAVMTQMIAATDSLDINPVRPHGLDLVSGLDRSVAGRRIGYLPTIGNAPVDLEVRETVFTSLRHFADAGAIIEETSLDLPGSAETYIAILSAGTALLLADYSAEQRALMEPALLTLARMGETVSGIDYARTYQRIRVDYIQRLRALYARYDVLVLPTMPCAAFPVMQDYPGDQDGRWRADWTPFTFPFNLTSQPACSVPCGLTSDGLPIGLQIVGPWGGDADVLTFAFAFETRFKLPPPPLLDARPQTGGDL